MINIFTGINFALGILTVFLSLCVARNFYLYKKKLDGKPKKLSNAICYQLIGESIISCGTLVFAVAAHLEVLPFWSQEVQSSIRFFMFFATALTTWHLSKTLNKF